MKTLSITASVSSGEVCLFSLFSASRKATEQRAERKEKEAPPPLDPLRDPLRVGPPRGARGRMPPYGR